MGSLISMLFLMPAFNFPLPPSSEHQLQMQCFLSGRYVTFPSPTEADEPETSLHHHEERTVCQPLHTREELSVKYRKSFLRKVAISTQNFSFIFPKVLIVI